MPATAISTSSLMRLDVPVVPTDAELAGAGIDPRHLAAARECEAALPQIVEQAAAITLKAFRYSHHSDDAPEKCRRDLSIVLRYCIFSMLTQDEGVLRAQLLAWLAPVLHSRGFPEGEISIRSAYSILRQEAMARVSPESADMIEPYLEIVVATLGERAR
jgi:hypothetical protein